MSGPMSAKRFVAVGGGVAAIIILFLLSFKVFCDVDASETVVKQSLGGELTVWVDPGWHWQGFGTITRYTKSEQFTFQGPPNHPDKPKEGDPPPPPDDSIHVRFNDNGAGRLSGSLSFDLPSDEENMIKLHKKFRSMAAIRDRLVEPALNRAVFNSGPLMSSRESAGIRRSELIQSILDQGNRGAYKTIPKDVEVEDYLAPPRKVVEMVDTPIMNEDGTPKLENGKPVLEKKPTVVERPTMKKVVAVEPALDDKGRPIIQEPSAIAEFGIRLYNITIDRVYYEDKVQEQIDRQRDMEMAIQTKIAEAKQAEQDVVTTQKKGEAEAAKAKWDQEVKKAQAITEAEQSKAVALTEASQKFEVAQKDLESAKLQRQATVERAQGESEAKKLLIQADGALEAKLAAYVEVNKAWAAEIGKQRWVPDVQMGGASGGNSASELVSLLQAKTARDLSLDLSVKK